MNSYPRETKELVPLDVRNSDVPTANYQAAVKPVGQRPGVSDWTAPVTLDGKTGIIIDQLAPGTYVVFARPSAGGGLVPVIELGALRIT